MENSTSDSPDIGNKSDTNHFPACKEGKAKRKKRNGVELMAEFYGIGDSEGSENKKED